MVGVTAEGQWVYEGKAMAADLAANCAAITSELSAIEGRAPLVSHSYRERLNDRVAKTLADYQDKVGDSSRVEWLATVAHAQAKFTREVSEAYATSARELLVK